MPEETLTHFLAEIAPRIQMDCVPVPDNPWMDADFKRPNDQLHFHITLIYDERSYVTYYTVGMGIVEHWALESPERSHIGSKTRAAAKGKMTLPNGKANRGTVSWAEGMEIAKNAYRPSLRDLLSCAALDAVSIEQSPQFEDWADELGYSTDSRKAERIWSRLTDLANELRRLFGVPLYRRLLAADLDE